MDKERLSPAEAIVTENIHGIYCVPIQSRHRPAARMAIEGRVYEQETIEFMAANCGARDIVHAGAYFGDFLPALSRAVSPGATVYAFEPQPENFRCAQWTVRMNWLTNVRLANVGLSDRSGTAPMAVRDKDGVPLGGGSRVTDATDVRETTTITLSTIDAEIPPDADIGILQLDIEFHEVQALTGGLATIKRCKPIVILETPLTQKALAETIGRFGYAARGRIGPNTLYTIR